MDKLFKVGLSNDPCEVWVWEVGCDFFNIEVSGCHVER